MMKGPLTSTSDYERARPEVNFFKQIGSKSISDVIIVDDDDKAFLYADYLGSGGAKSEALLNFEWVA
jgi:hypothetical protein